MANFYTADDLKSLGISSASSNVEEDTSSNFYTEEDVKEDKPKDDAR